MPWSSCRHRSREWIIDVLAESNDRLRRIAFEIYLSSQTPEKYQCRSQRYFKDQVFPVWQATKHQREADREAGERDEERRQREALEARIEEMNQNSAAPEAAFGAHTVHTEEGPFVWPTLTQCWNCEHPMLLWNAQPGQARRSAHACPCCGD